MLGALVTNLPLTVRVKGVSSGHSHGEEAVLNYKSTLTFQSPGAFEHRSQYTKAGGISTSLIVGHLLVQVSAN